MNKIDITALARENVRVLKPYSSARDEYAGEAALFLDANENPYTTGYNRYPDPHQRALKQAIGTLKGIGDNQLFLGNGSDEAIDLLIRAFCSPGQDNVLIPQPTYGMYAVSAAVNDIETRSVLLTEDFQLDVERVLATVTPNTKIIFLCSPNNPSGNLLHTADIDRLLAEVHCLVVVDEAYVDFTEAPSWTKRLHEYNNLVILQTLSKAWGLAGLRIGLCIADPEIITFLNRIKPPYNINSFTQAEALRRLQEEAITTRHQIDAILKERRRLMESLQKIGGVSRVFPSDANFVLVRIENARKVYDRLVTQGIVVRDRSSVVLCQDCLRITIGTPEENQVLINQLRQL
jgi:histidinol-phosphate aminotransferase